MATEGEGTGADTTEAGSEASSATSFVGGAQSGDEQQQQETDEQRVAREAEEAAAGETPEQKEAREAAEREEALKNETPEQKAEREAKEALTADAPEEYADFKVPDGFTLAESVTEKLKAIGKDANLSQARTQQLVDIGVELTQSVIEQQTEGFAKLRTDWQESVRTDEEVGGAKLQESLGFAAKFRDAYGTPALTELLNESGMGDHPEVVRLFARAGKAISDAKFVNAGKSATERPLGAGFYGNSNMKD